MAEDLAQETMLRAVRSGSGLRDPRAIKVWLLRIVENLWIDWCRAQGKRKCEMIPEAELAQKLPEPSDLVSQAEEVGLTIAAMRKLPERQRSVLHLIACED